jgi:hypothetical protein
MKSKEHSIVSGEIVGPWCGPKQYEHAAGQASEGTSMKCGCVALATNSGPSPNATACAVSRETATEFKRVSTAISLVPNAATNVRKG